MRSLIPVVVIALGCGERPSPDASEHDVAAVDSAERAAPVDTREASDVSDGIAADDGNAADDGIAAIDASAAIDGGAASDGEAGGDDGTGDAAGAWLPEDVRARLAGPDGCVAVSASGRVVLSIVTGPSGRLLRLVDFGWDRGGRGELSWPLEERQRAFAEPAFDAALRGAKLSPCATFVGAPPFTLPTAVPITVSADDARAELAIDGNRPARVSLDHGQWRVAGAYYLPDGGPTYLRLVRASGVEGPGDFALENVGAVELGSSRCVPRPRLGQPLGAVAAPAFDAAPREVSCVAMTADGQAAAFKTWFKANGPGRKDAPNAIAWFGPGAAPSVELGCLARRCKPDELTRVQAEATAAGLVGCAPVKGAVALDGRIAPFVVARELVRLQGGSGWRTVFELADGPDAHETLWKAFQRPAGGPIFLYVGRDEADGMGAVVRVLDEAALGLCERPPADALEVTEVVVSGALKDRNGYKLGGSQLIDGDATTAWQPQAPAKGESAWAELVLDGEREVTAIEIANGFQRRDGNGDLFTQHARVAELVIAFPDGTSDKVTLAPDARGFARIAVTPRRAARVKLVIAGEHAGGPVAISEVRVIGR